MADTQRTKSALATILADNTTGEISPQDLRDLMESVSMSYGSLYITSSASTTIAAGSTWYKASGTTASVNTNRFTASTSNRLTYTGTPDVHCHVALSCSMTSTASSVVVGLGVGLNDSVITHSIIQRKIGTGSDLGAAAIHCDVTLSTNDYIEMFVANFTSATNVKLDYGYLFAMGMFV